MKTKFKEKRESDVVNQNKFVQEKEKIDPVNCIHPTLQKKKKKTNNIPSYLFIYPMMFSFNFKNLLTLELTHKRE